MISPLSLLASAASSSFPRYGAKSRQREVDPWLPSYSRVLNLQIKISLLEGESADNEAR